MTDIFCFIHERILLTHIIVLVSRNNMLHETFCKQKHVEKELRHINSAQNFLKNQNGVLCVRLIHETYETYETFS